MKLAEGSTVIGRSVHLKGELSGAEDVSIDGTFEGSIRLPEHCLTIGPNGSVSAGIEVRDMVVSGALVGNVHAAGTVDLRGSANVLGDVIAAKLSIEDGAVVRGKVELKPRVGQPGTGGREVAA